MKLHSRFLLFMSFVFLIMTSTSCEKVEIEDNHRGIIFKRFDGGINETKIFEPGHYYIAKWDRLITYNINTQKENNDILSLTKDEKEVILKLSYSFKPVIEEIGTLHNRIGKNYKAHIVEPEILSAARYFIGNKTLAEISKMNKNSIEEVLFSVASNSIRERYIELESIQIDEIEFSE